MPSSSSLGDRKVVVSKRITLQNNVSPPVIPNDMHKRRLRALNLFMAGIHTLLAIVTVATTRNFNIQAPVFRVSIDLNYTMNHAEHIDSLKESNVSSLEELFDVSLIALPSGLPIAWLTLSFFVLTALAHFGAAIVYPRLYHSLLERKCNPLRWIEYSITASIMWVVLAQAFAFVDVNSLVLSTAMIALTMGSGIQCEYIARPVDAETWNLPLWHRLSFLAPGILLYGTASLTLCIALATGVNGSLPDFVIPTVLAQLALFESFAIVLIWQQCNPPYRWIYGEYAYQWLSLFSKALLGIVLIVNVLIYEDYACVFDDSSC